MATETTVSPANPTRSDVNEEVTVDFDAIDAEVARGKAAEAAAKPASDVVVEPEPAKPAKTPVVTPDEGLEKLKQQLADEKQRTEDERTARLAAEQRANEAAHAEVQARTEKQTTELEFVANTITSLTQANDAIEEKLAAAYAAGDFAGAAKLNREMSKNSAQLLALEEGKARLEKAPKPQIRVQPDPVEQFASQLTPKSAAWVRAHPEYVRDRAKNQKMLAAHNIALADGLEPDSPAYFRSVEDTLKISAPAPDTSVEVDVTGASDPTASAARESTTQGRRAPASAPVTRSGSPGNGSRPNVVRLSAEEREIARMMKMSDEDYAREKVALQREGKLN